MDIHVVLTSLFVAETLVLYQEVFVAVMMTIADRRLNVSLIRRENLNTAMRSELRHQANVSVIKLIVSKLVALKILTVNKSEGIEVYDNVS